MFTRLNSENNQSTEMLLKIAENFYFADFKSSTCSVKRIKKYS